MAKPKTVAIYARIAEPDLLEVDKAADEEMMSRSYMIARIIRQWAKARQELHEQQSHGRKAK